MLERLGQKLGELFSPGSSSSPEHPGSSGGETAEKGYSSIGTFEGWDVGIDGNVVGTPETGKAYEEYLTHQAEYNTHRYWGSEAYLTQAAPDRIEGVRVRGLAEDRSADRFSVEKPENFWGMHRDETHERYLELTSHIPEINDRLAGKSPEEQNQIIRELKNDERLGACAALCFDPSNRVEVWEHDGFYEIGEGGRHRVLSARENMEAARQEAEEKGIPFDESRYELPVKVIGKCERENGETPGEDQPEEGQEDQAEEPVTEEKAYDREERWRDDREELLGAYQENLRDRGLSEEEIAPFIEEERSKMERDHQDLIHGVPDPYIYHDPQNWDQVAEALKAGRKWNPDEPAEGGNKPEEETRETEEEQPESEEEEEESQDQAEEEEPAPEAEPEPEKEEEKEEEENREQAEKEEPAPETEPEPEEEEDEEESQEQAEEEEAALKAKLEEEERWELEEGKTLAQDTKPEEEESREQAEKEKPAPEAEPEPEEEESREPAEGEEPELDMEPEKEESRDLTEGEEPDLDMEPELDEEMSEAEELDLLEETADREEMGVSSESSEEENQPASEAPADEQEGASGETETQEEEVSW